MSRRKISKYFFFRILPENEILEFCKTQKLTYSIFNCKQGIEMKQ